VREALEEALALTEDPYAPYEGATATERRLLNQAMFERRIVGPDFDIEATKTELYRALDDWATPDDEGGESVVVLSPTSVELAADGPENGPGPDIRGQGSNELQMVQAIGVEGH
jgi:hypothetical protein